MVGETKYKVTVYYTDGTNEVFRQATITWEPAGAANPTFLKIQRAGEDDEWITIGNTKKIKLAVET